jgi:diguanylate cyclase (GGDEF)-like protein
MKLGAAHLFRRVGLMLAVPVILIAGAVFLTAKVERSATLLGARQQETSLAMRSAMFDLEDGAHGFFESHDSKFLRRWREGTEQFEGNLGQLRSLVAGDPALRSALADQVRLANAWHVTTQNAISALQRTGRTQTHAAIEAGRTTMEQFRDANTTFDTALSKADAHRLTMASIEAMAVVATLAALLVAVGLLMARRAALHEAARQREHAELRELLQISESETEAHQVLTDYLQLLLPHADVAVLTPGDERTRLRIVGGSRPHPIAARTATETSRPASCLAMRLGRAYDRDPADRSLLRCELCGSTDETTVCEPLLVGGQTIGSVLVTTKRAISPQLREELRETIAQAAPILANQRNLAVARTLARSDALTGLSNRRAADETLERLSAQAIHDLSPLSVVLLDLDRLKEINDRYGHAGGDRALATLGRIISSTIRTSDFAARIGGDEFLVMLPDTDRDGALVIADQLRTEIEGAALDDIGPISASLGLATLPADATDAEDLLRKADRALYAAKRQGRNRIGVCGAAATTSPRLGPSALRVNESRPQPAGLQSPAESSDHHHLRIIASD